MLRESPSGVARQLVAQRLGQLVAQRLGLDFPGTRRADLERGLDRLSSALSGNGLAELLDRVPVVTDEDPVLMRLAAYLTVGETYFFRDTWCFDVLEAHVLPELVRARRASGDRRLRIWSAGCATGEEPYSLAILLDRLLPDLADWHLTILATDVNPSALEAAEQGRYRPWSFRQTPAWVLERYFRRRGETFEVDAKIRRMVTFAPLNLSGNGYPAVASNTTAMDVVLCRNVLMYFTSAARTRALGRLADALAPDGWLALSPAEAIGDLPRALAAVRFPGAILYQKRRDRGGATAERSIKPATGVARSPEMFIGLGPATGDGHQGPSPRHAPAPGRRPIGPGRQGAEAPSTDDGTANEVRALLAQARAGANAGRLDEARSLCSAALACDPVNQEIHVLLAAVCQEAGDPAGAADALRRALFLAPDSVVAHFVLASLLLSDGDVAAARRSWEAVLHLLEATPPEAIVPGSDGLTAGRLQDLARTYAARCADAPAHRR